MRILITGGSGYIGTRLMQAFAARTDVEEIIDVDLRPPRFTDPKVRFVERSVTDDLRDIFSDRARKIDVAMHLAWVLDPMHDEARQREICIGGTNNFLDGCVAGDIRHVVFMSSATAYGAHPAHAKPVSEGEPLKSFHHFQYSAEKREAEYLFQRFASDRPDTLLQIARPVVVGGPNVSNYIFRSIDKPVNFLPFGKDPDTQLVHEEDVAGALVAIVHSRLPGAFNLAADDLMKLSEAYKAVGARVVPMPMPVLLRIASFAWRRKLTQLVEAPPGFVYFIACPWLVSNRRVREEVGYRFRYTTRGTLDAYLEARRRH
jgi:UDP-glucose 4-epimerase